MRVKGQRVGAVHSKICPHIFSAEADPCVHTHTPTYMENPMDQFAVSGWVAGWLIPAPSGRSTLTPSPIPSPAASVRVTGRYGARASDRLSDRQGRAVAIEQHVSADIVHL